MSGENEAEWGMVCPMWIDTDAYSDRDRQMFVAGYEFCQTLEVIRGDTEEYSATIHRENESRIRMAAARFGRRCEIEPCGPDDDPDGTWSYLRLSPKG